MGVDFLMEGVEEGRFQGRTGGRGLLREKIVARRVSGLSREGRIRIHRGIVFHGLGLFGGARTRLLLQCMKGGR